MAMKKPQTEHVVTVKVTTQKPTTRKLARQWLEGKIALGRRKGDHERIPGCGDIVTAVRVMRDVHGE